MDDDSDLAAAILDRILERGCLIPLDGPSLRTSSLNPEGELVQLNQVCQNCWNFKAGISGIRMCKMQIS